MLGEPSATSGAPVERLSSEALLQLLTALLNTGQVPADKRVFVHDEGKNAVGLGKNWYQIPPVREWTAEEWCDILLRGQYAGASATPTQGPMPMPPPLPEGTAKAVASKSGFAEADVAVAAAPAPLPRVPSGWQRYYEPATGQPYYADASGKTTWEVPRWPSAPAAGAEDCAPTPRLESVDLAQFCEMLTSDLVCVWGECHRIAERKRLAKVREEEEDYRRNPPFYAKAWNAAKGMTGRE